MSDAVRERVQELRAAAIDINDLTAFLKKLRVRIRRADFTPDLLGQARDLEQRLASFRKERSKEEHLNLLKALCTCFKVYDYFGKYAEARQVIAAEVAEVSAGWERWGVPATGEDRALRKQQIFLMLCHAQSSYRSHSYLEARKFARTCERLVIQWFHAAGDPANATCARVNFFLGSVNRQLSEYRESRIAFTRALEYLDEHLRRATEKFAARLQEDLTDEQRKEIQDRFEQERAVVKRSVALCFAPRSLGWVAYITGHLNEALPYIYAARLWLYDTNDWVNKHYTDLLLGIVHRALAGYDADKLRRARQIVEETYRAFEEHPIYKARAAHELALQHLYLDELNAAERYADEVLRITRSPQTKDERWECKALVIQSRILRRRRDYIKAEKRAKEAFEQARSANYLLGQVDAEVARAEALVKLNENAAALREFEAALRNARDNVTTSAVCHLHLASTHLLERNFRLADEHWEQWLKLEDRIQQGLVHTLAQRVGSEREKQKNDFVVSSSEPNLNYDEHAKQLREFLLQQAQRRHESLDKIAEGLGVSRQTLYNWQAHPEDHKRSRRLSGRGGERSALNAPVRAGGPVLNRKKKKQQRQ